MNGQLDSSHSLSETEPTRTESRVLESKHEYSANMRQSTRLEFPGATSITITFDSRTSTEEHCAFVSFLKLSGGGHYGREKYSGGRSGSHRTFPGLDGVPPLVVPGSACVVFFQSTGTNTAWGWRFTAVAAFPSPPPVADLPLSQLLPNPFPIYLGQPSSWAAPPMPSSGANGCMTDVRVFPR